MLEQAHNTKYSCVTQ